VEAAANGVIATRPRADPWSSTRKALSDRRVPVTTTLRATSTRKGRKVPKVPKVPRALKVLKVLKVGSAMAANAA